MTTTETMIPSDRIIAGPGMYIRQSHCGYCGKEFTSNIFGFDTLKISCKQYQNLINRGFRRSGRFVHKPDCLNSCCSQYSMRLDVDKFKPTKQHRQALNRFNRFCVKAEDEDTTCHSSGKTKGKRNQFDLLQAVNTTKSPLSNLTVEFETSEFSDEKFQLFKRYQMAIHHEDEENITAQSFERFLCETPLSESSSDSNDNRVIEMSPYFRGSVHQMYYYKKKLLAIGFIDILDEGVSSSYLVWDPSYPELNLGRVSSLYEITLARELGLPYYYLGFYIDSCPKMHYKTSYSPSQFLDPQYLDFVDRSDTDGWFPVERFLAGFKKSPYVTMSDKQLQPIACVVKDEDPIICKYDIFDCNMPGILTQVQFEKECCQRNFDVGKISIWIQEIRQLKTIDDLDTDPLYDRLHDWLSKMSSSMASAIGLDLAPYLVIVILVL